MNSRQEAKLNMYRATENHCNENAAIVATVPAFATTLTIFSATVSTLISTAQQEDLVVKGITIDKAEAKKILSQLAADIAAPIFAYASANANNQLKQEVNFTLSQLLKTKDDILAPRCQNIHDAGIANLPSLAPYGITPVVLTAFQEVIDAYQQKVPTPRNSAAQKRSIRESIKNLFTEADTILKERLDKTLVGFRSTHPEFIATYKANRVVIDPARSATTIKGRVLHAATATPIAGAFVHIPQTDTQVSADHTGNWEIKPIPPGVYTIIVSATGFQQKEIRGIAVKLGQTTTLNTELQPGIVAQQ